jgi:glycine hydroxymethyltransferase
VANNIAMANKFIELGATVTTGGSDNHLFVINTKESYGITGQVAEKLLYDANIIVNKNTIPFDTESPFVTSGIRIGTPAMTTHGFTKDDFIKLAEIIDSILKAKTEETAIKYKEQIKEMVKK